MRQYLVHTIARNERSSSRGRRWTRRIPSGTLDLVLDFVHEVAEERRPPRFLGGFSRSQRVVRIAAVAHVFYLSVDALDTAVKGRTPE